MNDFGVTFKTERQMIHSLIAPSIDVMHITSDAFLEMQSIPKKYTCDGLNVNPSLHIESIPKDAVCLAIMMDDPDAPINTWNHWLVWNIPITHQIVENSKKGIAGMNDFSKHFYCGPCPMNGEHHYIFKVYALDTLLQLNAQTKKYQFEKAISGHVLAYGELIGKYTLNH
jgi:Raf kinase inhibitor-like YbhB/YbcL family protein